MISEPLATDAESPANLLSIDVEEAFQVSAFETVSPPGSWAQQEQRAAANTARLLDLLDRAGVQATFFVLSWVAERQPQLVRRVAAAGHEVASHGYWHRRVSTQTQTAFREDIRRAKACLEDLTGQAVLGYRAPSYSISRQTPWAFDELLAAGYRYDSSIFPVRHDFYGMANWPRFAGTAVRDAAGQWQPGVASAGQPSLLEVPITTLQLAGRNWPIAGGGYFRLLPYVLTRWGLRQINQREKKPFVFYLHPWEIDPAQPRMAAAGWKSRLRHYLNLARTEGRFVRLLQDFRFVPIRQGLGL